MAYSLSSIVEKLKEKVRGPRPNEAVIPPPLTFEEAQLAWQMQIQSQFKKAGMDKYLAESRVEGGTIRLAVPDEGGLCDVPDCPNDYKYALKLDSFGGSVREYEWKGNGLPDPLESDSWTLSGPKKLEQSSIGSSVKKGAIQNLTILVCEDHKDYRPTELLPHRFAPEYTPSPKLFEPGMSKVPNIRLKGNE